MNKLIRVLGLALTLFALAKFTTPAMAQTSIRRYNAHITTKTTTTVASSTLYIASILVTVSVAGTSTNTLTLQNKETTAKVLWGPIDTTSTGTKIVQFFGSLTSANNGGMIVSTSGLDIVTAGSGTACTVDVFITYFV